MAEILLQTQHGNMETWEKNQKIANRIGKGTWTETTFGQLYQDKENKKAAGFMTEEEYKDFMKKIDRELEQMRREAKAEAARRREYEELKRLKAKKRRRKELQKEAFEKRFQKKVIRKVYYLVQSTNHKLVDIQVCALTDARYCDRKTGIIWFKSIQYGPYILGEEAEKLEEWCERNGMDPRTKFEEIVNAQRMEENEPEKESI